MSNFGDALADLCESEISAAKNDDEKYAEMLERLANALAMTIFVSSNGNENLMETLLDGTTEYVFNVSSGLLKMSQGCMP